MLVNHLSATTIMTSLLLVSTFWPDHCSGQFYHFSVGWLPGKRAQTQENKPDALIRGDKVKKTLQGKQMVGNLDPKENAGTKGGAEILIDNVQDLEKENGNYRKEWLGYFVDMLFRNKKLLKIC